MATPTPALEKIKQNQKNKTQILDLSWQRLSEIPPEISELTHLTTLDLRNNEISEIKGLEQLANLTTLNLRGNKIREIKGLEKLQNLRQLYLKSNSIQEPPIEVLKMDAGGKVDIDALFNYFKQLEEQGEDNLCEAKMLIIGKCGAGKTSLRTKILNPEKPLPTADESTHGIDIETWKFPLENNKEFRVNIWDFGGQTIYHATHRYFLTNNALYVLVIDVRKDSEQSMIDLEIYWWLHAVELWGGTSPVLILQNDTGRRLLDIDMSALRKEFQYLDNKTYQINLSKIENNQHDSFNKILEAFKYQFKQLPNFEKKLPKIWVEIRQFIEEKQQDNWMPLNDFMKVCAEKKLTQKQDAELLLSTFHELGICLWFQDHDYLRKIVILNPSWVTNSAYAVLQNETVKNSFGRFTKENLKQIWCEDCYVDMRGELLGLMKKFELCYELPQSDHFIAPQLLENKPPKEYVFNPKDALQVYYKYDTFMPKGILHRLMVVLHEKIANQRQAVWLTGVLFEKDHAKAQVIEKYADREIKILVIGNLNEKCDLMSITLEEIDKINQSFSRNHPLQVDKYIPCQCDQFKGVQEFFSYQTLKEFANDKDKIR